MNLLAKAYDSAGRLEEALPLFEQTLEIRRVKLGHNHAVTLSSMHQLAVAYLQAGQKTEGVLLLEARMELLKAKLGQDAPVTLGAMHNLSAAYSHAGRPTEAMRLLEQTLIMRKAKLGPAHLDTLESMSSLANMYGHNDKVAEALPLLAETLALKKSILGSAHPDTLASMDNLAIVYLRNQQPEKALSLFDQFILGCRGQAATEDPAFAGRLSAVSLELLRHHQYLAAESYLRECLTIREKKLPDDWLLFNTKSLLGGALAGQKKFQEAESLLIDGYSGMKARETKIPPAGKTRLPEAIQRLVDLYVAWEKPELAAEWQKQLDQAQPPLKDTEAKPSKEPPK